ncbi:RNA 2',3'-cyclic phosphodiesterase [bioreactor metagenome]|uniref:RNA 2',3'-cyclic phosphodiesterase n=1 Tax=bioreactor metagenome TaxID=1076179 RepID=A0A645H530_9ZZZZ
MRLFIAIDLDEEIKESLYGCLQRLKTYTVKGSFTRRENFHLTLIFLGEIDLPRISIIKSAMERAAQPPFALSIQDIGMFQGIGGDICWIGVPKNRELSALYHRLTSELSVRDFVVEKREYKPHLTLGRQMMFKENFDKETFSRTIPSMNMRVRKISLMKSERIEGKLTYTEIYAQFL